jgi:predicted RNA-binding protein associated with RNAse of E/G family
VPGAQTLQLVTPRASVMRDVAVGREQTAMVPWHTNRVVWLMPFNAAHAIGHFWSDASDEFVGYYINLQAPLRRTPIGYDSFDHVLDIVVAPDGSWRWKDEDEFEEAIQLGLFTPDEAADIRAEGERVIARLSNLCAELRSREIRSPQTSVAVPRRIDHVGVLCRTAATRRSVRRRGV